MGLYTVGLKDRLKIIAVTIFCFAKKKKQGEKRGGKLTLKHQ